jgi:hypothetical protein
MKNPIKTKRAAIATLAAVATLGVATAAWAVFSSTTDATAGGASGNMLTLASTSQIDYQGDETQLWPNVSSTGGQPTTYAEGIHLAEVEVTVTNTNEVPVIIDQSGITGTVKFDDPGVQTTCGAYLKKTSPLVLVGGPSVTVPKQNLADDSDKATLTLEHIYLNWNAPNTCVNKAFTADFDIVGNAL